MERRYFGTDGIRGTVGKPPITPEFMLRLGHAVARVLRRDGAEPVVLIGKDTRISGYMLESALEAGFNSAGVSVVLLGPVPTPAVAYLTRAQRADLGVVISASHNPHADNGIKFFSAAGTKLPDAWEREVERALDEDFEWVASESLGRARRLNDAAGRYIEFCKSTFDHRRDLRGLKIVVDAAHGAAYTIAPKVFHELGADVVAIGCTPDGLNINRGVGATHPEALQAAVAEHGADYGVALDGDADRVQMVDGSGRLYTGDELLYLLALDRRLRAGPASDAPELRGVVGTLMTNLAVEQGLRQQGFEFVRAQVGDRYVLEALQNRGWILGGEGSGHLLVLDQHTTGDGLVSALQVLQACMVSGRALADLLAGLTLFPQVMVNVPLQPDQDWQRNTTLQRERQAIEDALGANGRVLIRPSGTEPLLRVMVEAREQQQAAQAAQRLAATLEG